MKIPRVGCTVALVVSTILTAPVWAQQSETNKTESTEGRGKLSLREPAPQEVAEREKPWASALGIRVNYGTISSTNLDYYASFSLGEFAWYLPKPRLGIGLALAEWALVGDSNTVPTATSLLPLYVHFMPFAKAEPISIQPVDRVEHRYGYPTETWTYWYNPAKSIDTTCARAFVDIYAGGSAWAFHPENDGWEWFGERKYFRAGVKAMYMVKLSKKPMLAIDTWPVGVDAGFMLTDRRDGDSETFYYLSLIVGFGSVTQIQ